MKTGRQPHGAGPPVARKGRQPYVVDHQGTKAKVYIVTCSRWFREGLVHELELVQSEDTQLALTHISTQRKLIAYDPLAIPCFLFPGVRFKIPS